MGGGGGGGGGGTPSLGFSFYCETCSAKQSCVVIFHNHYPENETGVVSNSGLESESDIEMQRYIQFS